MKRLFACLTAWLLALSLTVSAFALEPVGNDPLLVDDADLLTADEEAALTQTLVRLSEEAGLSMVIVTESTIGNQSPMEYADDFFDQHDYSSSGILLLLSMEDRDWWISTAGYGIVVVTDVGVDYLGECMVEDLSDGNYAKAFTAYLDGCEMLLEMAKNGTPYDVDTMPKEPFNVLGNLLVALGIGLVLAFTVTAVMRGSLKSVRSQPAASDYQRPGSMQVTHARELFLYRTVDRHEKPKDEDRGGSSTHVSSSGTTHGGGGGKF